MNKSSVVTINYNTAAMTEKVLDHLLTADKEAVGEIILIDNGSTESITKQWVGDMNVRLIKTDRNFGFAKAANQGIKLARERFIVLLNSDVFIGENALSRM